MSQFEFEDETNSPALNELVKELRAADRRDIPDIKRDLDQALADFDRALAIVTNLMEGGFNPFLGVRRKRNITVLGYLEIAHLGLTEALKALKP
jgi:hypothetical protein